MKKPAKDSENSSRKAFFVALDKPIEVIGAWETVTC